MFLKKKGITVNSSDIRKILDINDKTFKEGLKKIYPLYPEFKKRDKVTIIKNKIIEINNHFKFGDDFLTNSDKILRAFGPYIQNTTEHVTVGVVSILTLIKLYNDSVSVR